MSNHAYHNKGVGVAFIWIMVLTMLIPLIGTLLIDDTWDRFVNKYVSAWTSECWQIVNMNEYVVEIIIVNLDVTSV